VSWVAAAAWLIVASTDFLDGWVARRHGATTSGAFLDPLADKVLVLGALTALAAIGLASWVPVAIIGVREMAVSLYRSAVARNGVSVPARPLAKMKTATQDFAVGFILLPSTGLHDRWVGETFLWVSVALALISGLQYLADSRRTYASMPSASDPPAVGSAGGDAEAARAGTVQAAPIEAAALEAAAIEAAAIEAAAEI
jgi:CDP-diacylglycerol--glycerol-3-phosphate 3-phosphatidyltransferase